jgi:N-acetylneuraminic acid mutarotase
MQVARRGHTAHIINNVLYVIGGENEGGEISSVEAYNISSNSWSTKSSLSIQRSLHKSCVHDGKIYVFGGFTEDGVPDVTHTEILATVEMYDPATNSWTSRSPMANANWGMSCVTVNNKIYVFGGRINPTSYQIYDPLLNSWTLGGTMPTPRGYGSSASLIGNKIYLMHGYDINSANSINPAIDVLDLNDNTWSSRTPISKPRNGAAQAVIGETIYLAGGSNKPFNELEQVGVLESYRPSLD